MASPRILTALTGHTSAEEAIDATLDHATVLRDKSSLEYYGGCNGVEDGHDIALGVPSSTLSRQIRFQLAEPISDECSDLVFHATALPGEKSPNLASVERNETDGAASEFSPNSAKHARGPQ